MKESEKRAKAELKKYDVHTTKSGGAHVDNVEQSKSTGLRNLRDAVKTFRQGK